MDPILAQICAFGFGWTPQGWASCDGSLIAIQQNTALFSLLGTYFGGNGTQTFGLPDLRGRTIVGQGVGPGLTPRTIGNIGGAEQVVLAVNEMPSHNHTATFTGNSVTIKANATNGAVAAPSARNICLGATTNGTSLYNGVAPDVALNVGGGAVTGTVAIANNGQNAAHNNMQPFTVLNYCIATQGIYPSRQ
ncbi:MAG TPA: tail fiber protein [Williamwhitmania sp.]|nr:tail fiber protein [Williamwhitmania sp.]